MPGTPRPNNLRTPSEFTDQGSFLLDSFRKFYRDVVSLRRVVSGKGQVLLRPLADAGEGPAEHMVASAVSEYLCSELRKGALAATQFGGTYAARLYREAEFVMAALADEIFLHHVNWYGQSDWKDNLIEARMFESYSAGNVFFDNLDSLLKKADRADLGLATIYLLALQLGFEGKYRGTVAKQDLYDYRHRLFVFIMKREPQIAANEGPLFPEAYSRTINADSDRKWLPSSRRWFAAIIVFLIFYALVSFLIWGRYIDPILEVINPFIEVEIEN